METQTEQNHTTPKPKYSYEFLETPKNISETYSNLDSLLAANLEIAREKELYPTYQEKLAVDLMRSPLDSEKAFAYLGTMLGIFPPFAMFSKFAFGSNSHIEPWVVVLLLVMNAICGVVGYFSGKMIGRLVSKTEKMSWSKMLLILPFIGILWGILTGSAGGVIVFGIGAFFGAIIASMVGGIAIPTFTVFHRLLKKGDFMEEKHFFPIALGITCIITAYILGI